MSLREPFKGWGTESLKAMVSIATTLDTNLLFPKAPLIWDGNAIISAKTSNASVTIAVTIRYKMGDGVGYSQWYTLYDESSTKVNTFTSTDIFTAILYNQTWFNNGGYGFQLRFTRSSGSGDTNITCEGFFT